MNGKLSRRKLLHSAGALVATPTLLAVLSCEGDVDVAEFSGATMGTTWHVTIADPPSGLDRQSLSSEMRAILDRVDSRMSTWRADSEISAYNRREPMSPMPITADTATVIAAALRVSDLSSGAFDATIGPAVRLWGFGPDGAAKMVPRPERVDAALARTGSRHLELSKGLPVISKRRSGLELDLSGIAKGFAVDCLSAHLNRRGLSNHLVEIGGELRMSGLNPTGGPWRIGIEKPVPATWGIQRVMAVREGAVATSGNYRNFFESGGALHSHVIDPRIGRPVRHELASVTVAAETCMEADALSTAMMVLGPEAGVKLAKRLGTAALFVAHDRGGLREIATPAFARFDLA